MVAQLRRLHYDLPGSASAPVVAALVNFVDRSQVLYGSDWPFTPEPIVGAAFGLVTGDDNPITPGRDGQYGASAVPAIRLTAHRGRHLARRVGN